MKFYNNNFKSYRLSRGLTHEEVGKLLGVSKQAVQAWESGKNNPRASSIKKLTKILKCSIIDISDLPPEKSLLESTDDFIIQSEEEKEILKYFRANKLARYELLAKIEKDKQNSSS